ncbi:MAG: response regulator transcription factor [Bacteroidota bacterium]
MNKTQQTLAIVLADDHEMVRNGFQVMLKKAPGVSIVAEASNGKELIQLVERLQPDVVFTDIKMPIMDGIEATTILSRDHPEIPVIGLSTFDDNELVLQMMAAGAKGYMLKNTGKEEIIAAARRVAGGGIYFCSTVNNNLNATRQSNKSQHPVEQPASFSEKEISIIRLICQEYSNKEIAGKLFMSLRSVESYRDKIFQKTGAKNMAGIVTYAFRHGIYKLDEPGDKEG